MEGEEREEATYRERERKINMEREIMCVWCGEIERQRRRDGGRYRYRWRGERGKNICCTRCIDFSVDDAL